MTLSNDARFWDRSARDTRPPPSRIREAMNARCGAPANCWKRTTMCWNWAAAPAAPRCDWRTAWPATWHGFFTGHDRDRARKAGRRPGCRLSFLAATAEDPALRAGQYDAVLAFNYLHLVRDLPGTLRLIHALLADGGLFISKTGCLGDMNPLIRLALLPAMRPSARRPYRRVQRLGAKAKWPPPGSRSWRRNATPTAAATGGRTWSRASAGAHHRSARVRAQPAQRCRLVPR